MIIPQRQIVAIGAISCFLLSVGANSAADDGALADHRHRVVVSTDIGGTDPDDFQSMVHLLVYADSFDIEGLISSPYGPGRKSDILTVIDHYERDYKNLRKYSDKYPTANALRAITKQGETEGADASGIGKSTEGSQWLIQCARRVEPRPLHLLVWGGMEDLAQALHDAPEILPKLRVYWIGGPNKKWGVNAYNYVELNHPKVWMIEANATYRGWFVGGNQKGQWSNTQFVTQHIAGHGSLGDYFNSQLKGTIKMGDTPSVARLLRGESEEPEKPSWGGKYVRIWDGRKTVFHGLTTEADKAEVFGVTEFVLPLPVGYSSQNAASMIFNSGVPASIGVTEGDKIRFRFSPRDAKVWFYVIKSDFAALDGQSGKFDAAPPPAARTRIRSTVHPNWWIDDPDPAAAEGVHPGAKSVNQWREEFLSDFAKRMDRCVALITRDASAVSPKPSPHHVVERVALSEVRWTSGFWEQRFTTCREKMVPAMWEIMSGTQRKPYLEHFRIAAGLSDGSYRGAQFNDGDFYKWMEAVCALQAVKPDPTWGARLDEIIAIIGKAQRADGYIHTPVLIASRNGDTKAKPFGDRNNFEMYNMGHLMTTACLHHEVTGKDELLTIACKAADFLDEAFREPTAEEARHAICPSHYMGLIDLYRTTGQSRYLELAKRLIQMRDLVMDGGDDNQDRIPFLQQSEATGHAVRATYLYAGVTDLYAETGDERLWSTLGPIWQNLVGKKMYITGGCGALYDGASPEGFKDQKSITRVHQAFGRNYQLPNITAHNETCANIGIVLWNWRMFRVSGEAKYIDTMELALYNSVLSGVGMDGTDFFYTNRLRHYETAPELRWPSSRVPYMTSFCCPPNVLRTIAEVNGYAYSKSKDTVWVNLYGNNTLDTTLQDGSRINLKQESDYPWNGDVRITVIECKSSSAKLNLRVPGWAKSVDVKVDGTKTDVATRPGSFVTIPQELHPGMTISMHLSMPAQLIESHPLVEETRNHIAVKRGPIVYCLESVDLPKGTSLADIRVPSDISLQPRFDAELLHGVTALEGTVISRPSSDWNETLYRELPRPKGQLVSTRFVPYYAWANRGKSDMTVWLPTDYGSATPHIQSEPQK